MMLFALGALFSVCTAAQKQSLTTEFAGLSAKERTRLAKQEQEEAALDVEYQHLMEVADEFFRTRSYEQALVIYQTARKRRPLNVNPKVKIEDLMALLAQQKPDSHDRSELKTVNTPALAVRSASVQRANSPPRIAELPTGPSGDERTFRLGNASVLERTVELDGRPTVFRRVSHNWGGVFYFQGTIAITARDWKNTFDEQ
jgi:hypothetical protein